MGHNLCVTFLPYNRDKVTFLANAGHVSFVDMVVVVEIASCFLCGPGCL